MAPARAELILAGAKPRRDAITGRDALTAGELRAGALTGRLDNRQQEPSTVATIS